MGSRYVACQACAYKYITNDSNPCCVCSRSSPYGPIESPIPSEFKRQIKAIKTWDRSTTGLDTAIDAFRIDTPINSAVTSIAYHEYVPLRIKNVIFNDPATIVFWSTGDKTIVKCAPDDEFDPEKGLAMAICKKFLGENFKNIFKTYIPKSEKVKIQGNTWLLKLFEMRDKPIYSEKPINMSPFPSLGIDVANALNKVFKRWANGGINDET